MQPEDDESVQRDTGKPPLHGEKEGADHQVDDRVEVLVQQGWRGPERKHIISCCKKVSGEINTRHDLVVNILLNNILIQRGLTMHEEKWEERKTVRTAHDEITVGTEHPRSDENGETKDGLRERGSSQTSCGSDETRDVNGGRLSLM